MLLAVSAVAETLRGAARETAALQGAWRNGWFAPPRAARPPRQPITYTTATVTDTSLDPGWTGVATSRTAAPESAP